MYYNLDDYILFNSFQCVLGEEIGTCIFKKVRNVKEISDRIEYIKEISDTNKKLIYLEHKKCMYKRDKLESNNSKSNK